MPDIVMRMPEKPHADFFPSKKCISMRSVITAKELYTLILCCAPSWPSHTLHVLTYTYNDILVQNLGPYISRFLFAQRKGFCALYVKGETRQLTNNHSKIIMLADEKGKTVHRAWLGSGNFVGPDVLYDFFIEARTEQMIADIKEAFEFVWSKGTIVKENYA